MKRFPHTAIITIDSGRKENGVWIPGEKEETPVNGLFCWSNSGQQIKKNRDGNEFIVRGEFSTRRNPTEEERSGVTRIRIDQLGIDLAVEDWEPYQKHSVIYV